MSKGGGGAGKVYFVLYLAVVLELLIIIVERDEAEEGLLQKQKETMQIVESILSQLQSGAGTEGINTRPQDEITIPPPGIDMKTVIGSEIKPFRKYIVEVGVTDVSADLKRKEEAGENPNDYVKRLKKLVELSNVEELEYQVYYHPSEDPANPPEFLSESDMRKVDIKKLNPDDAIDDVTGWKFKSSRLLKFDLEKTYNRIIDPNILSSLTLEAIVPQYPSELMVTKGSSFVPKNLPEDSVFFYSDEKTREKAKSELEGLKKRSFVVNFEPPSVKGWYKLRFSSRTNRILGIRADQNYSELKDDATVNIGTVQLTVRDLRRVLKELQGRFTGAIQLPDAEIIFKENNVERFDTELKTAIEQASKQEDAVEMTSKIRLYSYIVKLLAPGLSSDFSQNKGAIEFNIRVITPTPQRAEPTITMPAGDLASFDAANPIFEFSISPYQGTSNTVTGLIKNASGSVVATVIPQPRDLIAGSGFVLPAIGERRDYIGKIDKQLSEGLYTIELTHRIGATQGKTETKVLTIFKTGLEETNRNIIDGFFKNYSYYGNYLIMNPIPTSGNKIKADQFRIEFLTDKDNQRPPVRGLNITRDNNFYFDANANRATLRIYWQNPYSDEQIDLYKNSVDIRQKAPTINTLNMQEVPPSGTEKRIRLRVRNITVLKPETGGQGEAQVRVFVDKNARCAVEGYSAGEPQLIQDGDTWTIELELNGTLPKDETKVKGTVTFNINAQATNPINGKVSNVEPKSINLRVNFEPEKESTPGRGGRQQQQPTRRR